MGKAIMTKRNKINKKILKKLAKIKMDFEILALFEHPAGSAWIQLNKIIGDIEKLEKYTKYRKQ